MKTCILCGSNSVTVTEQSSTKAIINYYIKYYNFNTSKYLPKTFDVCKCNNCELIFFEPLISVDEAFYDIFQKGFYYYSQKEEYKLAKKFVKPSDKLLDVGCGTGEFCNYLKEVNYTGLEFNNLAIQKGIEKGRNIINQSIEQHAINNFEFYDVVASFQVIEHLQDPYNFVKNKLSCLKKGGLLIICMPTEDSYLKYLANDIPNLPPHHLTRWSKNTAIKLADLFNIELLNIEFDNIVNNQVLKIRFFRSFYNAVLMRRLGIENRKIDYRLKYKLIDLISHKFLTKITYGVTPENFLGIGENMLCIYRKL